jgi:hypothetical protein
VLVFGRANAASSEEMSGPESGSVARTCFTPAGQRLVVERDRDVWVVLCDDFEPTRHNNLDVALLTAVRADAEAHWGGIEPGRYTRLIADVIASSWQERK